MVEMNELPPDSRTRYLEKWTNSRKSSLMVLGVRTRNSFRGAVPARGQKYSREIESLAPGTLGPGVPDPDHTVGKILTERRAG